MVGLMMLSFMATGVGAAENAPSVLGVTAITKVIGDGQKVAAVAVEYSKPIDSESLAFSDYTVPDREVVSVYLNKSAAMTEERGQGNFVIVELKTSIDAESASMGGGPSMKDEEGGENEGTEGASENGGTPGFAGPKLGEVSDKPAEPVILTAEIIQTGEIFTEDGQKIPPSDDVMKSDTTVSPDIEDFQQRVFHDGEYNRHSHQSLLPEKDHQKK